MRLSDPPTVLVVGHVTLDRYGEGLTPGGTVGYATHTYRGLGARVRAVTRAAPDYPVGALDGVETVVVPSAETTTFVNSYGADGQRSQRVEAVAPALEPGSVPPAWRRADVVHLAPVLGELDLGAWVRSVRARWVGIGVQGWVRAVEPGGAVAQPPWQPSPEDLRGVDVAVVGEDDLRGQGDLLDRLVAAVPIYLNVRASVRRT